MLGGHTLSNQHSVNNNGQKQIILNTCVYKAAIPFSPSESLIWRIILFFCNFIFGPAKVR